MNAEDLPNQAIACATQVIRCIKSAHFWPPNPKAQYDRFERLSINGLAASIDTTALLEDVANFRATHHLTSPVTSL
jgi:hypothetical protein